MALCPLGLGPGWGKALALKTALEMPLLLQGKLDQMKVWKSVADTNRGFCKTNWSIGSAVGQVDRKGSYKSHIDQKASEILVGLPVSQASRSVGTPRLLSGIALVNETLLSFSLDRCGVLGTRYSKVYN